ncbi:hypothetical protein niasHT_037533 [Heterodera trifolii]|uniref:GRIP domain-containing protein n=1 Tax=Heterodera trifolii TaxID=157864 RepID=A0ABD2ITB9_9BILA
MDINPPEMSGPKDDIDNESEPRKDGTKGKGGDGPMAKDQPGEVPVQQQHGTGGGGTALAKLDLLSREDLVKLAKKQLIMLKDTRKQLTQAKKESEEYAAQMRELSAKVSSDSNSVPGKGDAMIAMELADYKNALIAARKELADNATKMGEKEAIVEEFSQRIDQLQQQKEEINSELRTKNAQIAELIQQMEAKSRLLSEHAKESEALQLQLNEARQNAQEEMVALRNEQRQMNAELANVRRTADARGAEVRRLRADSEMNAQMLAGLKEEFAAYKERAECALAESNEGTSAATTNGGAALSSECQQLFDTLSTRNAQMAELSAKCSFLEEELRSGQLHSKTLLEELNSLHDQQQTQRQRWASERQRMVAEHAERMRAEETLRTELRRELQATREREAIAAASRQMEQQNGHQKQQTEMDELRRECDRLSRELDEAKTLLKCSSASKCPSQSLLSFRPNQLITLKHQSKPSPLNLGYPSQLFTATTNSLEMDGAGEEEGEGVLGTTHSESSDSLDDLHSVLQGAIDGAVPGSDTPMSFNVASLAEHFGDGKSVGFEGEMHANFQQQFVSRNKHQEVLKLLEDCRELLSETEEDNVRLSEQVNVLKEEIRRMERCKKRVEHLGNGVCPEYFKNIVLKFLAPPKVRDERVQLLPVLQTILHLDAVELEQIRCFCTAQRPDETDDGEEEEDNETTRKETGEENDGGWTAWIGWK